MSVVRLIGTERGCPPYEKVVPKMDRIALFVICLCVGFVCGEDTYKAGVILGNGKNVDFGRYISAVESAGRADVDILVLPTPESSVAEANYDEIVKNLSKSTRRAGLYLVAHLYDNARCQNNNELIRTNLVFDRDGNIITAYRKPVNFAGNCTSTNPDMATFTTDFGVKFTLLMEEDLILQNPGHLKNTKNFIVTGDWSSGIPLLRSQQISSTWAFTTDANLLSPAGIFAGKAGAKNGEDVMFVDLNKNGVEDKVVPPVVNPSGRPFPYEDLSQYIIRPLDLEASSHGYIETVCHKKFCCEFYIRTNAGSNSSVLNYGLAAFDGTRHFSENQHIGAQTCAVFACAGVYKRSCEIGSGNNTDVIFQEISISGNFTKHNSIQYPMIISTSNIEPGQFSFTTKNSKSKQISTKLINTQFLTFGVFGRDFSKDFETPFIKENNTDSTESVIYDLFYNEEVQGVIDYLWIRLRILIFVVSIYILEMM